MVCRQGDEHDVESATHIATIDRFLAFVRGTGCAPTYLTIDDKMYFLTTATEKLGEAKKELREAKRDWADEDEFVDKKDRPRDIVLAQFMRPACVWADDESPTYIHNYLRDMGKLYQFGVYIEMNKRGKKWCTPRDVV